VGIALSLLCWALDKAGLTADETPLTE
jgi:hypothetical protein